MTHSGCQLILETSDGVSTPLLASNTEQHKRLILSQVQFRIVPFQTEAYYVTKFEAPITKHLGHPGVWVFLHLYSSHYQQVGLNAIHLPLQLFFNLNVSN